MKWPYFKSWVKSPRFQKWGLFFLLALSLGFNLSMNPEHFNNIARYEKGSPMPSYELAQETPPAKPAQEITVAGKKGVFKARVFQVEGSTFAKFESLKEIPEGQVCELCKMAAKPLSSSIDKISDLAIELQAIVDGKTADFKEETKVAEASNVCPLDLPGKPKDIAEISEEQITACAAKCDKASDSAKMTCHKNRLVELSKALKNSSALASSVNKYFQDNIFTELKSGFTAPTVREVPMSSCEGNIVYYTRFGVGCEDTTNLENAREIAKSLMSDLKSQNGKTAIETLVKLEAASFSAQTRNAQVIGSQGKNQGNFDKWNYGFRYANPNYLIQQLDMTHQDLLDTVLGRSDKSLQQQFMDSLNNRMYQPVSTFLADMQRCGTNKVQQQVLPGQAVPQIQNFQANQGSTYAGDCQTYLDYQVPNLGEGPTRGDSYTPGSPGNIPAGLFAARQHAVRGTVPQFWLMAGTNAQYSTQLGVNNGVSVMVPGQISPTGQVVSPNGVPLQNGRQSGRSGATV